MIGSLLLLGLLAFGLAFLAADASLFGVSAKGYVEVLTEEEGLDPEFQDAEALRVSDGILRLRNGLLKIKFFRELLSCYFCLGLWCGMAAHALLVAFSQLPEAGQVSYALAHGNSVWAWLGGLLVGGLVGAPLCYGLDLLYGRMEKGAHG